MASHESDSDDSAPESISFGASKLETAEQKLKIKEQINKIRESQKLKRIERQEKYIEQKKKKFDDMKLPDEILEDVADETEEKTKKNKEKNQKNLDKTLNNKKTFDNLDDNTFSDFVPLKTYSKYGISVVNLENTNKKPLIASDKAKTFKASMFNRPGIRRQTAQERIAIQTKRSLVKISK